MINPCFNDNFFKVRHTYPRTFDIANLKLPMYKCVESIIQKDRQVKFPLLRVEENMLMFNNSYAEAGCLTELFVSYKPTSVIGLALINFFFFFLVFCFLNYSFFNLDGYM